jgi:hypothetical protein
MLNLVELHKIKERNLMKILSYILIMIFLSTQINAHEYCEDDLNIANILYEKTIVRVNEDEGMSSATRLAQRFQIEAYEFKSLCQEKLESDNKKYTYRRMVQELAEKEMVLYTQGLLKNIILAN